MCYVFITIIFTINTNAIQFNNDYSRIFIFIMCMNNKSYTMKVNIKSCLPDPDKFGYVEERIRFYQS